MGAVPIELCLGRLTDPVDLGPAVRASPNCCRLAVLHRDWLRVFHLDLSLVLQTIAFHLCHRLTDFVDLGPAVRASPNCCRLPILHCDRLRIFHLDLSFVLQTISFQTLTILSRNPFLGLDSAHSRGLSRPDQPQFNLNSAELA